MRPDVIAQLDRWGLHLLAMLVPTSAVMYGVLFLVAGGLFWRRSLRNAGPVDHGLNLWILSGIAAVFGARLYYLIISGAIFTLPVREWVGHSGTASWGVYLSVFATITTYAALKKLSPWYWLDLMVSVQPIGEVIGRIGCWLEGDDFGKATQRPWGIRFPAGSQAWVAQVASGQIPTTAATSLPVHPEQLYLAANALILFVIVTMTWRRLRDRPGQTLTVYLLLYGVSRFCWEFFRAPPAGGWGSVLSPSQWMCVVYVVGGVGLLLIRWRGETSSSSG